MRNKLRFTLTLAGLFLLTACWTFAAETNEKQDKQRQAHPMFEEIDAAAVEKAFEKLPDHPRLLLTNTQMIFVDRKIKEDPRWNAYYLAMKKRGDDMLKDKPLERVLEGVRLLTVSRKALHRLFIWSFLYQYTHDKVYLQRAEKEMLALADFSDWHPEHYLDTAEMTMAMAIGYDACYNDLSAESRKKIKTAILEKGVNTSLLRKHQGWMRNAANWNQVCHGGMLYGVLAIAEDELQLAREIVRRSVNGVTWSMASYEPDGNYTEGPGYWGYGTSFNIMLIAALQSALGTDFGRSDAGGLLKSINYYEHVFGATGDAYNYPDSGGGKMFEPTAFWFAEKLKQPGITWNENKLVNIAYADLTQKKGIRASLHSMVGHRLAPTALLWGPSIPEDDWKTGQRSPSVKTPKQLGYVGIGNGLCPVFLARTSWTDPNAGWLGIKAGTPRSPHGHMDAGSFVYEVGGVRWAVELGAESYHKIEQLGMKLWSSSQDADRWKIFRYNNFSHNTLTINGTLQKVKGLSKFEQTRVAHRGERSAVTIDLTSIYEGEIASAERKAVLAPSGLLTITDSLKALPEKDAAVQWRMLTPATVEVVSNSVAKLTLPDPADKKKTVALELKAESARPLSIRVEPAATDKSWDAKNPGISVVIISFDIKAGRSATLEVSMARHAQYN